MSGQFQNFSEFYPYYLKEHSVPACRALHYMGSTLVLMLIAFCFATRQFVYLWGAPVLGYGFAWAGHFFFEKNRPATFTYPLYSLMGDWVMYKDFLTGRIKKKYQEIGHQPYDASK